LFQPPLSQVLHWYNVYIYSKRILNKTGTNLSPKIRLCFIFCAKSATEYIHLATDFLRMKQAKKLSQIRPPSPKNRPPIFCFQNSNFFNFESLSQQNGWKRKQQPYNDTYIMISLLHKLWLTLFSLKHVMIIDRNHPNISQLYFITNQPNLTTTLLHKNIV